MEKKCLCCKKILANDNFYYSNNLKEYPDGCLDICKNCLMGSIDIQNQDTYLWILRECDVPYIPSEWNKLLLFYKNKTILGRYLTRMKLLSFKHQRWEDTFFFLDFFAERDKKSFYYNSKIVKEEL